MKEPRDLAERYLLVARRDLVAFQGLLGLAGIADETIGFHAKTTIKRSDFGVKYGVPLVPDDVPLEISVAFEKDG